MRIRSKEIHRSRKRDAERLREKIKSLRNVKPVAPARGGSRPSAGRPAPTRQGAPRAPRPKPAANTDTRTGE